MQQKENHEKNALLFLLLLFTATGCEEPGGVTADSSARSWTAGPNTANPNMAERLREPSARQTRGEQNGILYTTIRRFLVFLVRFSCSHFHKALVRYRYRSYPACSIASSDIDSDPERTTTPVAARLRYEIIGQENDLFGISFTYRPERETDPDAVVVTGFTVTGGGATPPPPIVITRGKSLHHYTGYTQTFRRTEPRTDIRIEMALEGRPGVEIRVTDAKPLDKMPVGTVVQSILPWATYREIMQDRMDLDYDVKHNRWAPCDGRGVAGSELARLTQRTDAPDLRGVFLRGLNQFDLEESTAVTEGQRDPESERAAGGPVQPDKVGGHSHKFDVKKAPGRNHANSAHRYDRHESPAVSGLWHVGTYGGGEKYPTKVNPSGETRPKNVAVFYYIKIN
uniref:Phage Tail Collar Domain n=1 Tax=Candidatus Kentrum sp. FM TaxID=2126340 RepID=A0A450WRA7_9GAMM|nr:MAG: hypothetical protein BECKFM1743B_GA0114221_106271 [Candidatus Kentron sp. FM]